MVSDIVKQFFEGFEKSVNTLDLDLFSQQYADSFLFCDPNGTRAVQKEGFLQVIPKRKQYFLMVGLQSSKIISLEEQLLSEGYLMVKVQWEMHYEKEGRNPIKDRNTSTYILFQKDNALQIIFQLDHQDLIKKAESLGLLPKKTA